MRPTFYMLSVKINRLKCQTETYTIRSKFVGHRSMFKRCYFDGDAHWKSKVFTPKLEQQLVAPVKDPLESCQYQKKQMIRISRVSREHCHTSGRSLKIERPFCRGGPWRTHSRVFPIARARDGKSVI